MNGFKALNAESNRLIFAHLYEKGKKAAYFPTRLVFFILAVI